MTTTKTETESTGYDYSHGARGAADHDEAHRFNCDGTCGYSYSAEDRANPASEAEALCADCYAVVGPWNPDGEPSAPAPADPGKTERIPNVSMRALVFGSEVA